MTSATVRESSDRLSLGLLPRVACDLLVWDRDGHRRRVPHEVIGSAIDVLEAARLLVDRGILDECPVSVGFIKWDETEPLPEVNLACDPLPGGRQGDADDRSVDTPAD